LPLFFRGSKMSKLASEEDMLSQPDVHIVVIDRSDISAEVGLTLTNTTEGDGVLIYRVKPDSLAAHAGLRSGMVILTINEHKVGTHAQAVSLIDRSSNGISRLGLERSSGSPRDAARHDDSLARRHHATRQHQSSGMAIGAH